MCLDINPFVPVLVRASLEECVERAVIVGLPEFPANMKTIFGFLFALGTVLSFSEGTKIMSQTSFTVKINHCLHFQLIIVPP